MIFVAVLTIPVLIVDASLFVRFLLHLVPQLPDWSQDDFGLWDMLLNDECASVASAD